MGWPSGMAKSAGSWPRRPATLRLTRVGHGRGQQNRAKSVIGNRAIFGQSWPRGQVCVSELAMIGRVRLPMPAGAPGSTVRLGHAPASAGAHPLLPGIPRATIITPAAGTVVIVGGPFPARSGDPFRRTSAHQRVPVATRPTARRRRRHAIESLARRAVNGAK